MTSFNHGGVMNLQSYLDELGVAYRMSHHPIAYTAQDLASADSVILDRCRHWINLARVAIDAGIPAARIVPMADS